MMMDWARPLYLTLALPALALAVWFHLRSLSSVSPRRRRALVSLRSTLLVLVVLALAGPAWKKATREETVVFIMDHSRSQGRTGMSAAYERANRLAAGLPRGTYVGFVSAGASSVVRRMPSRDRRALSPDEGLLAGDGAQTDLASAVALARGLLRPGMAGRLVLVGDGAETRNDLETAAREAALSGICIDAAPVAGEARPDVRVVRLRCSRSHLHEGASLALTAEVESSLDGTGQVSLFENGVEIEARPLRLTSGQETTVLFRRTPERRNLHNYRVRVSGFEGDAIPENDEAMTLVDVRGRPSFLYVEGEPSEARYLAEAMAKEGIRLDIRRPQAVPGSLQALAGYDAIILSDVPACELSTRSMALIRDYVEHLGGGFLMIGGMNSFGVGGYYRTPIEDVLPVKMKAPDKEVRYSTALALVIDRSGSMSGHKIEICKSAAIATSELLSRKDYIGVVVFDSAATWVVPMTRATSQGDIAGRISTIDAGGGTNIHPGMTAAHDALRRVRAKVKHVIVLSDGQTQGGGYQALAAQMAVGGITVSTVAVGSGADAGLLQMIAAAGGGKFYMASDPDAIPRIFTQDAMIHMGRLIREEAFRPKQVERHPMLDGWAAAKAPPLLGYVKTHRKATSQVPLVTDLGDPLLAHWRFGLGKVTAFTSDCKSRWSATWIAGWREGYAQFWAQVLRETAREPRGRRMDIHVEERGSRARVTVDLVEDAARFKNQAEVEADVYFVPAAALGSSLKRVQHLALDQVGPGRYEGRFTPGEPGVYLVRARSGADMVSAGVVHNVSNETAAGRVNLPLLEKACELTGGKLLRSAEDVLPARPAKRSLFAELAPVLLMALLLVFAAELAVRRWENVLGILERLREVRVAVRGILRRG